MRSWWHRPLMWGVWWVVCLGLWLLLSDKETAWELGTGAAAAALAATLAEVVRVRTDTPVVVRLRWIRPLLALGPQVVGDTVLAFAALGPALAGRPPQSALVEEPVDPGSEALRAPVARAALVAARSLSPATIVLGVDDERRTMVVHRLFPARPQR